jgi:hypothetical protein
MTKQQDNDGEHNTSAPSDLENADAELGILTQNEVRVMG